MGTNYNFKLNYIFINSFKVNSFFKQLQVSLYQTAYYKMKHSLNS